MRSRLIALSLVLAGLALASCGSLGELERPARPLAGPTSGHP